MHTARSSTVTGSGLRDRPSWTETPQTDKCFWKHYLPPTSFAGGNKDQMYQNSTEPDGKNVQVSTSIRGPTLLLFIFAIVVPFCVDLDAWKQTKF